MKEKRYPFRVFHIEPTEHLIAKFGLLTTAHYFRILGYQMACYNFDKKEPFFTYGLAAEYLYKYFELIKKHNEQ